jgi:predicted RNase H-like nuclease (RuvC/YqgF family)
MPLSEAIEYFGIHSVRIDAVITALQEKESTDEDAPEIADLQKEVTDLEEKVDELEKEVDDLSDELQEANNTIETLETELIDMKAAQ